MVAGRLNRLLRHAVSGPWRVRSLFPGDALNEIEREIGNSESKHSGQIRFVVEHALHPAQILRAVTPRERAIEIFSDLRVWDTEHNSGVLIYLLLAERDIEIIADRGISIKIPQSEWDDICKGMESNFKSGEFKSGVLAGIQRVTALLASHFPKTGSTSNELSNKPVVY